MELNGKRFKIELNSNSFSTNSIIIDNKNVAMRVLEKPKRIWYKLLLEKITFSYYKAPYQYKVENYDKNKN